MSHGINHAEAARPLLRIPAMGATFGPPTDAELGLVAVEAECAGCGDHLEDHNGPAGECDWCPCHTYTEDLP